MYCKTRPEWPGSVSNIRLKWSSGNMEGQLFIPDLLCLTRRSHCITARRSIITQWDQSTRCGKPLCAELGSSIVKPIRPDTHTYVDCSLQVQILILSRKKWGMQMPRWCTGYTGHLWRTTIRIRLSSSTRNYRICPTYAPYDRLRLVTIW